MKCSDGKLLQHDMCCLLCRGAWTCREVGREIEGHETQASVRTIMACV